MRPVLIALCVLFGITVFLFFFSWCFAFFRGCCKACKLDLSRTDYRKHEKTKPGIYFAVFNFLALCLIGLGLFQFLNMWFYFASTFCVVMSFLTAIQQQLVITLYNYDALIHIF
jgi:hypothetical protein